MDAAAGLFRVYEEADWREAAAAAIKGASLDSLASKTADGVRVEPVYRPAEGARAFRANGPWRIIARLDHPDADEANAQALDDLANGADGLQVVFSGALRRSWIRTETVRSGRLAQGVRVRALRRRRAVRARSRARGSEQALSFAGLIERSGARPSDCAISFGLDPCAACARVAFTADWAAMAKVDVDTALALRSQGFAGPLLVADARAVHAAGGAASQELAFALGAGVSLLRALTQAGVGLAEARALIAFRLAADADQFVTLSKFRALRLAWARVEEACGLEPRAAHVQAESAWRMMTARDPYVNLMRGAIAAFSAGLGGADSVSVLPHTLALGLPDSFARRLARNAQLILLRESRLGFVADPAAGAGAFQALSEALSAKGWALFQEVDAQGGLPAALASGAFQRQVSKSAAALRQDVARLISPITGVSTHPDPAETRADVAPGAPDREAPAAAEGAFAPMRLAEPFERLRDASDAMLQKTGARPKVYLVALGSEPSHRRRIAFVREWLEAGGVEPVYDGEAATPDAAVERLRASGASLACLCRNDEIDAAQTQAFARAIRASGVMGLSLAGPPGDAETALRDAGIDGFIFVGADAIAALQHIHRYLGA